MLWWFTEDDCELCLGTEPHPLAGLVIATDVFVEPPICRELAVDELKVIGDITTASIDTVQELAAMVAEKAFTQSPSQRSGKSGKKER